MPWIIWIGSIVCPEHDLFDTKKSQHGKSPRNDAVILQAPRYSVLGLLDYLLLLQTIRKSSYHLIDLFSLWDVSYQFTKAFRAKPYLLYLLRGFVLAHIVRTRSSKMPDLAWGLSVSNVNHSDKNEMVDSLTYNIPSSRAHRRGSGKQST